MSHYKLTREEQETVIRSSSADSEWDVVSADPRFIRYLKRQGFTLEVDYQLSDHLSCKVPFRNLRVSKRRNLTDEQKARMANRLKSVSRNRASPGDKTKNEANASSDQISAEEFAYS